MNLNQALKIIGVEDYQGRIINSNSHGEMFHLMDYVTLAQAIEKDAALQPKIEKGMRDAVKFAEENWERPESIFQHMDKVFGG